MRARCSPEPGSALGSVTLPSFSQFPSWGLGRGARPGQAGGRRMRCHIQARGRETGARDGTRANPGRHGSGRWAHLAFNQLAFLGQFATSPSLEHKLCESLRPGCGDLREVPAGSLGICGACWHALRLQGPLDARRSNQSILKEVSPEYSLEGLMLKLKLQYFGHLMRSTD